MLPLAAIAPFTSLVLRCLWSPSSPFLWTYLPLNNYVQQPSFEIFLKTTFFKEYETNCLLAYVHAVLLCIIHVHVFFYEKMNKKLVLSDNDHFLTYFSHKLTTHNCLQLPQLLVNYYKRGMSEDCWRRNPW